MIQTSPRHHFKERVSRCVQIVELPEYYPYKTEHDMLHEHVPDILRQIPAGSVIVELGCGSATKTAILLQALLARCASASGDHRALSLTLPNWHRTAW